MSASNSPEHRGTANPTSEEIQQEIERTRAQLGETAGALAHKLDPKAQAKERFEHAREVTQEKTHRAQQAGRNLYREHQAMVIGAAATGVAVLVVAAILWRRHN